MLDLILTEGVTHYRRGAPIPRGLIRDAAEQQGIVFDTPVEALIGGAPPPASLLAAMASIDVSLMHIYGLTKTYGAPCICEPQVSHRRLRKRPGRCWATRVLSADG